MKNVILTAAMVFGLSLVANAKENTSPDAQAIDSACTQEASTAGCGSEKVGTGLLRCIHAYRKEHKKDFKISDGCKSAMKKMHEDRKGLKRS
jgi:hypothetical protein